MPESLSDSSAQGNRAKGGEKLELVTAHILNRILNKEDIFVLKGTKAGLLDTIKNDAIVTKIIDFNKLPVKRPCDQQQLEDYPDTDLFVLLKTGAHWKVLGIINNKVSFHSRHTMVTFWGLAVRIGSNIRYVCVTEDVDQYRKDNPRSELGRSCKDNTSPRRLLESFTDGVYLIKFYNGIEDPVLETDLSKFIEYYNSLDDKTSYTRKLTSFFDNPEYKYHTEYCKSVKSLDELVFEIIRWKRKNL